MIIMKSDLYKLCLGGVILGATACSSPAEPAPEAVEELASVTSSTTHADPSADTPIIHQLPGTWQIAGYFHTHQSQITYSGFGQPFAVVTHDSLRVYSHQYEAQELESTPQLTTHLVAAYSYTPLSATTLLVDSDTVTLTPTAQGLCLTGSKLGALFNPYTPESHE